MCQFSAQKVKVKVRVSVNIRVGVALCGERDDTLHFPTVMLLGGGLAELVTSLVASTKLINAGPG